MTRLILDAGAFIALERGDTSMWRRLATAEQTHQEVVTHAGIVGQVWRSPARQAQLARILKTVDVRPLTIHLAKQAGLLLATSGHHDVHDAALAQLCAEGDIILTSDVNDLLLLLGECPLHDVTVVQV
jgi:predicted nucleic acid-binding protein